MVDVVRTDEWILLYIWDTWKIYGINYGYMDIWIYGCMVEPLGNWETGIMSTPDFAKPWFMKIRGVLQ